jgi:hypothetical protein
MIILRNLVLYVCLLIHCRYLHKIQTTENECYDTVIDKLIRFYPIQATKVILEREI